ncbi:MAG: hypothetical protein LQ347_000564 [Umbilicaria vellea]|nr:MAG: hypothetical protein LQ347_000564 [Umbilicaria vellea]
MPVRRAILPREADVLGGLIKKTALNPALTLPLFLYAHYHHKGQDLQFRHPTAFKRLKLLLYLGLVRWANEVLNRGVLDNWQGDKYDWSKEIVLVTGGSDGIGKALVLLLAERGIKTVVLDIRPLTFEDTTSNVHFYHCDITSPEAVSQTASEIRSSLGAPTILVNNAGVATGKTILEGTEESVENTFAVNLLAHFRLVREFLPSMIAANHGMVVTIASMAAYTTLPNMADYACTKAGALAFHEGLAAELKTRYHAPKVRTVCVTPNWVQTKMTTGYRQKDRFVMPLLKVETMAEAIFLKIMSGTSGKLVLPAAAQWLGMTHFRAWPLWLQTRMRNAAGQALMTWTGRSDEATKPTEG